MPKLSSVGRVPRYRHHKGSGQAVVRLGDRDVYLGKYRSAASRERYERLVAEWLQNGGRLPSAPHSATVVEIIAAYLRFARGYYVKGGEVTNEVERLKAALQVVKQLYGRLPAVDFGPLALKACREAMIRKGWCRIQVNKQTDRVKRTFKWAAGEELVPGSVYESLRCVAGLRRGRSTAKESAPILPVDDATIDATVRHLPAVVADMVRLQRLTGCRPQELCLIRPCDIDRSGEVWRYVPQTHKTEHSGRERVVFIGPKGQGVLLRYLARDSQSYCFRPCDSEAKRRAAAHAARKTPASCGNTIGTNRKRSPRRSPGEQYDKDTYRHAIHRACDKAFPVPSEVTDPAAVKEWKARHRWSPNRLRHAAATEIRRTFGLEAAQVALGHAAADTTQIYAERDYTLAANVAAKIG